MNVRLSSKQPIKKTDDVPASTPSTDKAFTVLYTCDPEKNTVCAKENCYVDGGPCTQTKNREFAINPDIVKLVFPMTQDDFDKLAENEVSK